jgi:glycolate oxidase FAD binding subunit
VRTVTPKKTRHHLQRRFEVVDLNEIIKELTGIVGQKFVTIAPESLEKHAVDGKEPKMVVFPGNTQEVAEVVRVACRHNLAIVPWGNGSKMAQGNPPERLDMVLGTSRMNHMRDVDTSNLTITVEAGVRFRDIQTRLATEEDRCYLPLEDLNTEADDIVCSDRSNSGCFLPIDPCCSEAATIGGVIAANSAGPRRLLYTLPRDMILGVKMVTPKGDIAGAGGKTVKNVSGYDTSKLMVGSMGSLGVVCEMTFKLLPLPEKMHTVLTAFDSFPEAADLADRILGTTLLPAAVTVLNGAAFQKLRNAACSGFRSGSFVVATAIESYHKAAARMATEIRDMAKDLKGTDMMSLQDQAHPRFWLAVSNLESQVAGEFPGLIQAKLNYPISCWRDIFSSVQKSLHYHRLEHAVMVHAGSGICQIYLMLDPHDNRTSDKAVVVAGELLERTLETGGNMVIQRAPVSMKGSLKIWGKTGPDFVLHKRLKEQLDPAGIMSPGRFVGNL